MALRNECLPLFSVLAIACKTFWIKRKASYCDERIKSVMMPELETNPTPKAESGDMFSSSKEAPRSFPFTAVGIAAVAVAILVAVLVMLGRRGAAPPLPSTLQPAAPYAANLIVSDEQMSESTSLSGGKSTYVDGHIANHGPATVSGITVQVVFANDLSMPPQIETVPLNLVRTREPYIDTEPVSAAPLTPGGEADFRLIFENVNTNWNLHPPEIRAIQIVSH